MVLVDRRQWAEASGPTAILGALFPARLLCGAYADECLLKQTADRFGTGRPGLLGGNPAING